MFRLESSESKVLILRGQFRGLDPGMGILSMECYAGVSELSKGV